VQYLEFAKSRFDAAIEEILRLKHYEFPYPHIKDALDSLERVFRERRQKLDAITTVSTPMVAKTACQHSLLFLFRFTPYLGFIVRSTNVRNAFELYPPLMRLARKALGPQTKLLLSSEWDYSPVVYLPPKELADFVIIGVPAFESANALLIPLAGHELGHSIWRQQSLDSKLKHKLEKAVLDAIQNVHWLDFEGYCTRATKANLTTDIFVREAWLPILGIASRQLEEVYCDAMGSRLFGESYLHAFAYLLAPGLPSEQPLYYPEISKRVGFLLNAAKSLKINAPVDYADLFQPQPLPSNPVYKLFAAIAGDAIQGLVADLIAEVTSFCTAQSIAEVSDTEVVRISDDFSRLMPCEGRASLPDIVSAGWRLHLDPKTWSTISHLQRVDHFGVLNDLVLKSCEVTEYEERLLVP